MSRIRNESGGNLFHGDKPLPRVVEWLAARGQTSRGALRASPPRAQLRTGIMYESA
jgi:hypothetical protein